ncbi:hypothetical protein DFH09DRAFT_1281452 [Mycena vulgaris]|nr:hypothetical protein DFH09DRAFT_1281452 [Mycena vulgaris]
MFDNNSTGTPSRSRLWPASLLNPAADAESTYGSLFLLHFYAADALVLPAIRSPPTPPPSGPAAASAIPNLCPPSATPSRPSLLSPASTASRRRTHARRRARALPRRISLRGTCPCSF